MNKVLNGILDRSKYSEAGKPITPLNVPRASSRTARAKGEKAWYNVCSVLSQRATYQGRAALIEGRLDADENGNPRVYEKKDGGHGASYDLVAEPNGVEFLGGGNGDGNGKKDKDADAAPSAPDEESIPF